MKKPLLTGLLLCIGLFLCLLLWQALFVAEPALQLRDADKSSLTSSVSFEATSGQERGSELSRPSIQTGSKGNSEKKQLSEPEAVALQFQELYAALKSGDAEAGSRLWRAMQGCKNAPLNQADINSLAAASEDIDDRDIALKARLELSIAESKYQDRCKFFSQRQRDMYFDVLERSARAGDNAAAIEYFKAGPSTSPDDPFQEVQRAAQAKEAYELIHLAIDRGSPEALPALARAEAEGLYGRPDPVAAYAALYAQVLAHGDAARFADVYLRQLSQWESSLSAEQRQQAISQAESIARRCCA